MTNNLNAELIRALEGHLKATKGGMNGGEGGKEEGILEMKWKEVQSKRGRGREGGGNVLLLPDMHLRDKIVMAFLEYSTRKALLAEEGGRKITSMNVFGNERGRHHLNSKDVLGTLRSCCEMTTQEDEGKRAWDLKELFLHGQWIFQGVLVEILYLFPTLESLLLQELRIIGKKKKDSPGIENALLQMKDHLRKLEISFSYMEDFPAILRILPSLQKLETLILGVMNLYRPETYLTLIEALGSLSNLRCLEIWKFSPPKMGGKQKKFVVTVSQTRELILVLRGLPLLEKLGMEVRWDDVPSSSTSTSTTCSPQPTFKEFPLLEDLHSLLKSLRNLSFLHLRLERTLKVGVVGGEIGEEFEQRQRGRFWMIFKDLTSLKKLSIDGIWEGIRNADFGGGGDVQLLELLTSNRRLESLTFEGGLVGGGNPSSISSISPSTSTLTMGGRVLINGKEGTEEEEDMKTRWIRKILEKSTLDYIDFPSSKSPLKVERLWILGGGEGEEAFGGGGKVISLKEIRKLRDIGLCMVQGFMNFQSQGNVEEGRRKRIFLPLEVLRIIYFYVMSDHVEEGQIREVERQIMIKTILDPRYQGISRTLALPSLPPPSNWEESGNQLERLVVVGGWEGGESSFRHFLRSLLTT